MVSVDNNVKMTFVLKDGITSDNCSSSYGWSKIEIIEFNYDGQGNALSKDYCDDGSWSWGEYNTKDPDGLREIFWGEDYILVE